MSQHPAPDANRHTLTGDIRRIERFSSRYLTSTRDLLVYLPPGYEADARRRYPVLYLHDGQNLFDGATSYVPGEEWEVDESAERLIAHGLMQPVIIVAIGNAGSERVNEFAPTFDERRGGGGHAHLYGRMLVREIKPLIDGRFRTRRGQSDTGVGGSSMGGLLSLYVGLSWPGTFGRLAIMSPSVWWDGRWILTQLEEVVVKSAQRIWLDVGRLEGAVTVANTRELRDLLLRKGWRAKVDLRYFEARRGEHSERAWRLRVAPMLRFLFPPER